MEAYKFPKLSIEEYIQHERESDTKYDYHNGDIYALAGGTLNHTKLCGNIYAELRSKLKNLDCNPYTSEAKLSIEKKNTFVYPDSIVICGEIATSEKDKNAITNPTLVVEVLSKSTAHYDRGDKFHLYRQIPSLQEYMLIEQVKPVVEVYYKKERNDLWQISRIEGLDQSINLQSLEIEISMAELYFDVSDLDM